MPARPPKVYAEPPMSMSKKVFFILTILLSVSGLFGVLYYFHGFPPKEYTQNTMSVDENLLDDVSCELGCGPPKAEISVGEYQQLAKDVKDFPELKPLVIRALKDGKINNEEFSDLENAAGNAAATRIKQDQHTKIRQYIKEIKRS